jgi:hypothetical protein
MFIRLIVLMFLLIFSSCRNSDDKKDGYIVPDIYSNILENVPVRILGISYGGPCMYRGVLSDNQERCIVFEYEEVEFEFSRTYVNVDEIFMITGSIETRILREGSFPGAKEKSYEVILIKEFMD